MREDEIKSTLEEDPGNSVFADYADFLRREERFNEALEVCLTGLSYNPSYARGRLVLARIFYDKLYWPFAIRELQELHRLLPDNESIKKLLEKLGESTKVERDNTRGGDEVTIAETDFDFEEIESLEEEEDNVKQ